MTRRTPMRRSGFKRPAAWTTLKRSPLAKVSPKRKSQRSARELCLRKVRARAKGRCEMRGPTCTGIGCDGHEVVLRSRGGDPTHPENVRWVCRRCHEHAHANPLWATEHGWMKSNTKGA